MVIKTHIKCIFFRQEVELSSSRSVLVSKQRTQTAPLVLKVVDP